MILSEFCWLNSNIKFDRKPVHFSFFSGKTMNFIGQLFIDNGIIKTWKDIKIEFIIKILIKCTDYKLLMLYHRLEKKCYFERQIECK